MESPTNYEIPKKPLELKGHPLSYSSPSREEPAPQFSIVTITYNAASELPRTFDGIRKLQFEDFEYIVVDGGSNDDTLKLLRENQDIIDLWVSEPDKGISDAFNKGIRLARGRIIGLINAGDWYEPDALSHIAQNWNDHQVLAGRLNQWNEDATEFKYNLGSIPSTLLSDMTIAHPSTFVSRKAYVEYGAYSTDFKIAMDYEFFLRLLSGGGTVHDTSATIANMVDGGASSKFLIQGAKEILKAKRLHLGDQLVHKLHFLRKILKHTAVQKVKASPLGHFVPHLRKIYYSLRKDVKA